MTASGEGAVGSALYDRFADSWWDDRAPHFRSLRAVKKFHLELLERRLGKDLGTLTIVDLGCGGGLLSVPLAELGANVIAVDTSFASLQACTRATAARAARPRMICGDALATPLGAGTADLVIVADLVEHVCDPALLLGEAARLLRSGGTVFVTTINRTRRARFLAVTFAENVGLVPKGTHDARLFVRPAELEAYARRAGLRVSEWIGAVPRVLATLVARAIALRPSSSMAVAYCGFFTKGEA